MRSDLASATLMVSPIEHTDLTEKVYDLLRGNIFARGFTPGARLDLDQLAHGFRVSRAPVNTAITRLAADGLVRIESRRGTFVRELTTQDVAETYEVRRALESRSAELGLAAATAEDLAPLEALMQQMAAVRSQRSDEYLEWVNLDRDFHVMLVGLARNRKMTQIYRDLHTDVINARLYFHGLTRDWRIVGGEHQEILAGYVAKDILAVRAAIAKAIENGQRTSVQRIEELGGII